MRVEIVASDVPVACECTVSSVEEDEVDEENESSDGVRDSGSSAASMP